MDLRRWSRLAAVLIPYPQPTAESAYSAPWQMTAHCPDVTLARFDLNAGKDIGIKDLVTIPAFTMASESCAGWLIGQLQSYRVNPGTAQAYNFLIAYSQRI